MEIKVIFNSQKKQKIQKTIIFNKKKQNYKKNLQYKVNQKNSLIIKLIHLNQVKKLVKAFYRIKAMKITFLIDILCMLIKIKQIILIRKKKNNILQIINKIEKNIIKNLIKNQNL